MSDQGEKGAPDEILGSSNKNGDSLVDSSYDLEVDNRDCCSAPHNFLEPDNSNSKLSIENSIFKKIFLENKIKKVAEYLALNGFSVFPCRSGSKAPFTPHGFKDATRDLEQIGRWFSTKPSLNLAIATGNASGIFVVDVDKKGSLNGFEALSEWESEYGRFTKTLRQSTPSGGLHLFYRLPANISIPNSASKLAKGIDIRGDGGYVVVAPSVISDVGNYYWINCPDDLIADAPIWLIEKIVGANEKKVAAIDLSADGCIIEGHRNDSLTRIAGAMRRHGANETVIFEALKNANLQQCNPPLMESEVASIARSIARYEPVSIENSLSIEEERKLDLMAAMPSMQYDKIRESEAKARGIRLSTLDDEIKRRRKISSDDPSDATLRLFPETDIWPEPVEAEQLLNEIETLVLRYIVCEHEVASTVALWIAFTWLIDAADVAPIAHITAPEKRCGKTLLLEFLGLLSMRPMQASNITAAALFRSIESWQPTLLIDEADTFLKNSDELRGVLNAGHTRQGAFVIRTVGDDHEPRPFRVWGAKAIAGIGEIPATLADRSIRLELRRRMKGESVENLRRRDIKYFSGLRSKLARFATDNIDLVKQAQFASLEELNDRAQDNWEILFAIAHVAGGAWPEKSRIAALKLSGQEKDTTCLSTSLLEDIRILFHECGVDRFASTTLIEYLCNDAEKPWLTYNRGARLTPHQLAKYLKNYNIKPKTIHIGVSSDGRGMKSKGYTLDQFSDVFVRYISDRTQREE